MLGNLQCSGSLLVNRNHSLVSEWLEDQREGIWFSKFFCLVWHFLANEHAKVPELQKYHLPRVHSRVCIRGLGSVQLCDSLSNHGFDLLFFPNLIAFNGACYNWKDLTFLLLARNAKWEDILGNGTP